jgi:hypothetical protein
MNFEDLLAAAQVPGGRLSVYGGKHLVLTGTDAKMLERLTDIRHNIEHPKPGSHAYETAYILEAIRPAVRIVAWLLGHEAISHHLDDAEHAAVRDAAEKVEQLCS